MNSEHQTEIDNHGIHKCVEYTLYSIETKDL